MTNLRDARFKKALETAPDADARPAPAAAQAIREAAHRALPVPVAPAAPRRWWQRLWQSSGSPRAPWGAAFATLLLAVLVTVMWVREPIPDARPMAPAAPSADATSATPPPPPTPPRLATPAPAAPTRSAKAPPVAAADKRAADEITKPPSAGAEPAAAPVAQPAPTPQLDLPRVRSKAYSALAAEDASGVARPPNDRAAAAAQTDTRLAGLEAWTVLSIQMEGRAVTLDRPLGEHLFAATQRYASRMQQQSTPVSEVTGAEPTLRLRILSQGQTLAVLELWDESALWRRPGQADVRANITSAEAQALLLEARLFLASSPPR